MITPTPYLGELTSTHPALPPSPSITLTGAHVNLSPLLEPHTPDLTANIDGPQNRHLYTYLPTGPDLSSFRKVIAKYEDSLVAFAILSSDPRHVSNQGRTATGECGVATAVGTICVLVTDIESRVIELGGLIFADTLKRTREATEVHYLLLKYCFEELGYSRVEWKTNSLNAASRKAALRLGYVYEGTFRRHMIVDGRRRDTAFFSIVEEDWLVVKEALEVWLADGNFDEDGKQRRRLEEIREELKGSNA